MIATLLEPTELLQLSLLATFVAGLYQGLAAFAVGRSTYFLSTAKTVVALVVVGPLLLGALFASTLMQPKFELQPATPAGPVPQR